MLRRKRKLPNYQLTKLHNRSRSRGYVLITLMLFFSLLAIAALAVLPDVAFQIKRDREEELIHRGVAYSRGIRRFYKKFGRYPTKFEDLESANNLRFIRKRYKDPVTGQDFRILRMGDPALALLGQAPALQGLQGQLGGQGTPGGGVQPRGGPGFNVMQTPGQQTQVTNTGATDATAGNAGNADSSATSASSSSSDTSSSSQQVFGGGPMLGVASTNKGKTVREFCSKSHYNDWLFIYDPTTDRGGALNTPWCPLNIQGLGAPLQQPTLTPSPPNTGAPGTVAPTPNPPTPPNPGGQMPPEQ